jgi:hypothetical protein
MARYTHADSFELSDTSNSFSYGNLEKDWSSAQETEYQTGASEIGAEYDGASPSLPRQAKR